MTDPVIAMDPEKLSIDTEAAVAAGKKYAQEYQSGKPFHYICIDDFLPAEIAQTVRDEALQLRRKETEFESKQEHLKASYNPNILPLYSRAVFNAMNSPAFLKFLEEMTGIPNLISDPYYLGGGIHRSENGGYLGIHADFNYHARMKLERRLNVLVYLNPDWKPEYGGAFEVWTDDMKTQVAQFPPKMNRMCCFSTSSNSYHGNPEPVNHPEGDPRLSMALYYYTATWDESKVAHSTLFRPRPGTGDEAVKGQNRRYLAQQLLPPMLYRRLANPLKRLGF